MTELDKRIIRKIKWYGLVLIICMIGCALTINPITTITKVFAIIGIFCCGFIMGIIKEEIPKTN